MGGNDGSTPVASLIQASDGYLYGTTEYGGNYGEGAVFQISTNGAFTPLYSFTNGNDGGYPAASLIQASDGELYGTAATGGQAGDGTVFKITTNGAFTPLHLFIGTAQDDALGALLISGGNFYGTTQSGGSRGQGSIFQVTTNGTLTTLSSFSYGNGDEPECGLIQASDGNLYGTTYRGGTNGYGTVFRISTNGALTSLYSFSYTNGAYPKAALVQASDGFLYGTTYEGGTNGYGTVFRISTNGAFTSLHSFSVSISDGYYPEAALIQASDGYLYGTTEDGGANHYRGTVFQISTNGTFTLLHSFGYSDGGSPEAALLQASDDHLYGTTVNGGTYGSGTVFQITTNGSFTSLYSFTGGNDGDHPNASLIQAANGDLYGTTPLGGFSGFGTVFQITLDGTFTSLYSFSGGSDGADPSGSLVAFDGYLYGLPSPEGPMATATSSLSPFPSPPFCPRFH